MGLSSIFGKKPVKQPAPAQGIAFASTADLERLLDGSDESFRAYYFALYHLYPDEICDFNSYRQQLCLAHPGNAVSVGYKTLTDQQRRWLKRRQAIEPTIGHTKHDHGMKRCWLKGSTGDALHAVLCAAGYDIRWLLRAIARGGIAALVLTLIGLRWMLGHMTVPAIEQGGPGDLVMAR